MNFRRSHRYIVTPLACMSWILRYSATTFGHRRTGIAIGKTAAIKPVEFLTVSPLPEVEFRRRRNSLHGRQACTFQRLQSAVYPFETEQKIDEHIAFTLKNRVYCEIKTRLVNKCLVTVFRNPHSNKYMLSCFWKHSTNRLDWQKP